MNLVPSKKTLGNKKAGPIPAIIKTKAQKFYK
jgi:hypothetical protein